MGFDVHRSWLRGCMEEVNGARRTMKFLSVSLRLFSVFNVIILSCFIRISNQLLPYAVTRFEGLEEYYQLRKHQRQRQFNALFSWEIDTHRKWEICTRIFHDKFNLYEHPSALLIYPLEHETQIQTDYQQLYDDLFVDPPKWWPFIFRSKNPSKEYKNPSRKRKILVHESEHDDYVFACLVREVDSATIRPYYVSRDEYNVNEAQTSYMAGRFLFVPGAEDKLTLFALVEESPNNSMHRILSVEECYSQRRAVIASASTAEDDPLCQLDAARRLRLCTATFMYELKDWNFRVAAGTSCERKRFAFWNSYPGPRVYNHEEWMIECLRVPAVRFRNYVSRGYSDNEVFVYLEYDNDLMIHYLSRRVAVMKDPVNYELKNKVATLT